MFYLVVDEWELSTCDNGTQYYLFDNLDKAKAKLKEIAQEVKDGDLAYYEGWYEEEVGELYHTFYGEDYAYSHDHIHIESLEVN